MFLPKIGWLGFYQSRPIEGKMKNITVTQKAGKWYASVQVEQEIDIERHPSQSSIGIDAGIKCFAAFSDGSLVGGPNSFRRHEDALTSEQRKLSRKQKGSENWKKQKRKISRLHHHIADVRMDFLHKLSTDICKTHATVYVERLNIRGMSASARGTEEAPGRNVRAKSGLNKSILDQGWFEFRRQLDYKLDWMGGRMEQVDARHTSQRCSSCGHTEKGNRKSQAEFVCLSCGVEQQADVNAAKNIITVGLTGMACDLEKALFAQSNHKSGRKQEPVGNSDGVLPLAS